MEVFAAQLAYQDAQFERLFDELERIGELDKTLIIFIEGDNGASAEGGPEGTLSEMRGMFKDEARFSAAELADLDRLGSERSYQNYPAGWAWALNAPFPMFKQNASHLGGTRNGMVISWPMKISGGVSGPGRTIDRFQHVIDIGPTILEAVGIAVPEMMDGVKQRPMQGTSLFDSFTNAQPAKQPRTQYFELLGHRALYQNGWWASTIPPSPPWQGGNFDAREFGWQLFDLSKDPAQAMDVADRYPDRLEAMKKEWDRQALENGVYPLQAQPDWTKFRPKPKRDEFVFWGSDVHLPWTSQPDLQRGNFTIEATFSIDRMDQAVGVLMATGSLMGGWSLKLEDGHAVLYNVATEAVADTFRIVGDIPVGVGEQQLIVRFLADSEKPADGGTVTMTLNGRDIAHQHVARRANRPLQTNELFDIGMDTGVSVIAEEQTWQRFQGTIRKVTVRQHQ
jgi:arylsulfatase